MKVPLNIAIRALVPKGAMTIRIDESVDVSVLLEYPAEALHPLLKHLKGWQEVWNFLHAF